MKKIDVVEMSNKLREKLAEVVAHEEPYTLAVLQVGNDPASDIYIRNKKKACESIGINFNHIHYKENVTTESLIADISALNTLDDIDGIMVQLPLPKHIDESAILASINPKKDVDGFSPIQTARLYDGEENALYPCTAYGIYDILENIMLALDDDLAGKNVVVVGRSHIVGKPIAHLLLKANATVTLCHSKTKNLHNFTNNADIVILATGNPKYFDKRYFNSSHRTIIIDAGISRVDGKVVGDLDVESLEAVDYNDRILYTPVPKGVGVMTVTMLLYNTVMSRLMYEEHEDVVGNFEE